MLVSCLKALSEQFIVGPRSLKSVERFLVSPDNKPVTGIGNVTLLAARPFALKVVHVMPSAQFIECFWCVLSNQVNESFELVKVIAFLLKTFHVVLKPRGVCDPQHAATPP